MKYYIYNKYDIKSKYKLSDIKNLDITWEFGEKIETFKSFISVIKYHINVKKFHLKIQYGLRCIYKLCDLLAENIPQNIWIDNLSFLHGWNASLLKKCKKSVYFLNPSNHLTQNTFNILKESNIESIKFCYCKFDGNMEALNLSEWKSLKKCVIDFDSNAHCDFIYKSVLLQPPNISILQVDRVRSHTGNHIVRIPIIPKKIAKTIKKV